MRALVFSKHSIIALASVVAVSLPIFAAPSRAWAEDPEYLKPSPLEQGGAVVRRKLLFRSTRFEAAPLVGFTLADPFNRNVIAGANLSFHLTNEFGIGGTFGFGVAQLQTDLRKNLGEAVPEDTFDDLAFSQINWLASVEASYVPIFGKLSIMNGVIVNYNLHFIGGVGFVGQGAEGSNPAAVANIEGGTVAPLVGFGGRFYLNDFISFNTEVRDYIFGSALVSRGNTDTELQNNLMLSVGASFFFPTAVKVSR